MKSIILAIPSYAMLSFLLPKALSKFTDKNQRAFWWGQKSQEKEIQWVRWETIRKPKKAGGMGFRDLHVVNLVLLAKQRWRVMTNPMSLCAKILKSIYFPKTYFLHKDVGKSGSWGWQSVLKGQKLLVKNCIWVVGSGENINI